MQVKVSYVSWINFLKTFPAKFQENRKIIPGDHVTIPGFLWKDEEVVNFFKKEDIIEKKEDKVAEICKVCKLVISRCKCNKKKPVSLKDSIKTSQEEEKKEVVLKVDNTTKTIVDTKMKLKKEGKNKDEIKKAVEKIKKSAKKKSKLVKCTKCGEFNCNCGV